MTRRSPLLKITGLGFILFAISANVPYWLLAQNFEYDDILRQPTEYVLTRFQAGGSGLILTWFAFALCALLFLPVVALLQRVLFRRNTPYLAVATLMGMMSGVLQAIGLMRWVFVVPVLARLYVDPNASEASRAAVEVVYQAVHQYGGVVIGEQLGQTLLVGWTLGVGVAMLRSPLFKRWVAWMGLTTVPLWLVGQSELFATVIPDAPVVETAAIAFLLWEIWLFVIGVILLQTSHKQSVLRRSNRYGLL